MSKLISLEIEDEDFWHWVDTADALNYSSLEIFIQAAVRQQIKDGDKYKLHADRSAVGLKTKI